VREIEQELRGYGDTVWSKTRYLVLNKMDCLPKEEHADVLAEAAALGLKYYSISAVTGEGTKPLLYDLYDAVKVAQANENIALDEQDGISSDARHLWVEEE